MGDDHHPNAAVLEHKLSIDEEKDGCSYDILRRCDDDHNVGPSESGCSGSNHPSDSEPSATRSRYGLLCKCVKVFFLVAFSAVLAFVVFKWVGPFFMDKVHSSSPFLPFVYLNLISFDYIFTLLVVPFKHTIIYVFYHVFCRHLCRFCFIIYQHNAGTKNPPPSFFEMVFGFIALGMIEFEVHNCRCLQTSI